MVKSLRARTIALLISVGTLSSSGFSFTKEVVEYIAPEQHQERCLTWDEAKKKYKNPTLVMMYMLEPCGI